MSEPSQSSEPSRRRLGLWLLTAGLLLAVPASMAAAQSQGRPLDAPRAAGLVGERYDGYAVARGAVAADVAALIAKVNAERQAIYAQRGSAQGVPPDAIGKIYAGEIIKRAPAGTWFLSESGQWTQK